MSQRAFNWGVALTALGLAGAVALFVARAVASAEVEPVKLDVRELQTQRVEDAKKIDEMRSDIKELLRRVP